MTDRQDSSEFENDVGGLLAAVITAYGVHLITSGKALRTINSLRAWLEKNPTIELKFTYTTSQHTLNQLKLLRHEREMRRKNDALRHQINLLNYPSIRQNRAFEYGLEQDGKALAGDQREIADDFYVAALILLAQERPDLFISAMEHIINTHRQTGRKPTRAQLMIYRALQQAISNTEKSAGEQGERTSDSQRPKEI
jgi:hypothetical protein